MIWQRLREIVNATAASLWFIPSVMILVGLALALAATALDQSTLPDWPVLYAGSPQAARDLVATLLTAMITMTSLIFSITMVVLTLAASQFGPRLIRNFMTSRQTQIVLGTYVMTIVHCLILSAALGRRTGDETRVWAGVTLAILLVLLSLILLSVFLHGLARSIMSETVIRRVGRELDDVIRALAPLKDAPDVAPEDHLPPGFHDGAERFGPTGSGYVRSIAFDRIAKAAAKAGCVVGLQFRAGDYVVRDGSGIAVFPAAANSPALRKAITRSVVIGQDRSPVQDVAFSIRHLVEIAVRALSPSLNDPYTAIAATDQLSSSLSLLMARALPPGIHHDDRKTVRVVYPVATHASLIAGGFDQIRQSGSDKPSVVLHLLEAIERIAPYALRSGQIEALRVQVGLIFDDAGRGIANRMDLEIIRHRRTAALQALTAQAARLQRAARKSLS